jgi:PAS domain S-box-containing protein
MTVGAFTGSEPIGGADRLRSSVRILLLAAYLLLACSLAIALLINRNATLTDGQRRVENLALILGDHLARTAAAFDLTLRQLALHGRDHSPQSAAPDAWTPVLEATKSETAGVTAFSVLDERGIIIASTLPALLGQSRADTPLFRRLATEPNAGLLAAAPRVEKSGDQLAIPLGRRLASTDGKFTGAIIAILEPERLRQFYRSIDVGQGSIWIMHPEWPLLFRVPSPVEVTDPSMRENPLIARLKDGSDSGFVKARLAVGGPVQLAAYRHLRNPPLLIAVSLAESDILAAWWASVIVAASVMAGFGVLLIFSWRAIAREIRARNEADRRNVEQAERLAAATVKHEQADVALRAKEAQFQSIMDHAPMSVCLKDLAGRYTFVNRSYVEFAGQSEESILGRTVAELRSQKYAESIPVQDRDVIEQRRAIQWEMVVPKPMGPRNTLIVKFPIYDQRGKVESVGSILADVTEQKRAEAQIVQAQRIEALGQLTGGIAHDFNNLLTSILLNADVLTSLLDDQLRPLAEAIRLASERGADLTRRLLAFGRRQMLEPRPTDVKALLAGMEALLHRTLGEHIQISADHAADLWSATVDPGQLENAVLNLSVNARDAMPNGGRLIIETSNVELDQSQAAAIPESKPGQYVVITVRDTGCGMTPEVAARAFEPFFTTKDVGKGTGLGLSMVYGFVKQSGGHVRINSEAGSGTTVWLYLPRSLVAAAGTETAPVAPKDLPTGTETILFVEDDAMVRMHTGRQIVGLGYNVIAAEHATDAIAKVEEGCVPDLLFTDVVMPGGINGRQLALELRRRWPGLRVLYTSGYAHGRLTIDGETVPSKYVLGKPYRRADLAAKLREVLDAPPAD